MTDNPAKFTPLKLSQLPSGSEGEGYPPDWQGARSRLGRKRWFPPWEAAHPLSDGELLFFSKIESQERASNETLWAQATQPRFVFWLTFQPAEKKEASSPTGWLLPGSLAHLLQGASLCGVSLALGLLPSRGSGGERSWGSVGEGPRAREPLTPLPRVWVKSRRRVWSNLVTEVLEVLTKRNKNKSGKTRFTDTTHRFLGYFLFGSPACRCLSGQ